MVSVQCMGIMQQRYEQWWQDGPVYRAVVQGPIFLTRLILRKRGMRRGADDHSFHRNVDISERRDGSAYETELHWCDGDYLLVQPVRGVDSWMDLYVGSPEGLTHIAGQYGFGGIPDLALGHKDPAALERELAYRAARKRAEWLAPRRENLDTLVATLQPKTYFTCPRGGKGYVAGVGKKVVTWRWVENIPDGVTPVVLDRPPGWSDYHRREEAAGRLVFQA